MNDKFTSQSQLQILVVGFTLLLVLVSAQIVTGLRGITSITSYGTIVYQHLNVEGFSEFRGLYFFWTPGIPYAYNWTAIVETMHEHGQNMIVYPVSLLNWEPLMQGSGGWGWNRTDLNNAIAIGHAYGLKVYVLYAVLLGSGRLASTHPDFCCQRSDSSYINWFTPCNPTVIGAIKDQVENLSVSGIDGFCWDYIRFDSATDNDFSNYSKAAFEEWLGEGQITDWSPFYSGGARHNEYMEWRVIPITNLVKNMREWALAKNPDLTFGAAVFCHYFENTAPAITRWTVSQDTADWVYKGYLDWVSPMIYTTDVSGSGRSFQGIVNAANKWYTAGPNGKIPLVIFICAGNNLGYNLNVPVSTFITEINYIRQAGANGWIIWQCVPYPSNIDMLVPYYEAIEDSSTKGMFDVFSVTSVTATPYVGQVVITWQTSLNTMSQVDYATTLFFNETWSLDSSYAYTDFHYWLLYNNVDDASYEFSLENVTDHQITLTNLVSGTLYYYRIQSWDSYGNATSVIKTFTTS